MFNIIRNFIVIFSLFFYYSFPVNSQPLKSIFAEFTRIIEKESSNELIKGKIYYKKTSKSIILNVIEPIEQVMIFKNNSMLIYYPAEKEAFKFTSNNPITLPFFNSYIMLIDNNFGLSKAGFTLARNEVQGDTLITYWVPPEKAKKILGNIILGMENNKLIFFEIHDSKGKSITKSTYQNHIQYGEYFFPLEIATIQYQEKITEKVVFKNIKFDKELPEELENFTIPEDIEITDIRW